MVRIHPRDKDAQTKLTEIDKELRRAAFLKAIESDRTKPASELVDLATMEVDASYDGPRLADDGRVTERFVRELSEHFQAQKKLARRYVYQILLQALPLLRAQATLVRVDVPAGSHITVCGDVHGQYYDVLNLFSMNGAPSASNPYLFNGDFVDRGSFSLEVILLFLSYKLLLPDQFHLTRGNHESTNMNSIYGFQGEVNAKVDTSCFDLFTEVFNYLPLAALLSSSVSGANLPVFVTHGGLFSEDGVTLEQIEKISRVQQPPETGLMCEILWSAHISPCTASEPPAPAPSLIPVLSALCAALRSDPQKARGRGPSKRGVGVSFGPDVTAAFCKLNGVSLVVRSHEVKEEGYEIDHDGQIVTVFSAPNCQCSGAVRGLWTPLLALHRCSSALCLCLSALLRAVRLSALWFTRDVCFGAGHVLTAAWAVLCCAVVLAGDTMDNKAAFIRFDDHLRPSYTKYTHVPHPKIPPMMYAGGFMRSAGFT